MDTKLTVINLFCFLVSLYTFIKFLHNEDQKNPVEQFPSNLQRPHDELISIKSDMLMQKNVYRSQADDRVKMNDVKSNLVVGFHYSLVPEIACSTMVRIGDIADGGKWICNPWRMKAPCIIHSWGVGGNPSFEKELSKILNGRCNIFSFDPFPPFASLFLNVTNVTFIPWRLDVKDSVVVQVQHSAKVTFIKVLEKLSQQKIEILKMDIEGAEASILPNIMKHMNDKDTPLFCQLLVEIHGLSGLSIRNTLRNISNAGFLLFQKEINYACCLACFEYSFIHLNCLQKYGLSKAHIIHRNFS